MGRQGEGAGPRSFPHPRRAAPGRTAVAIAPVHANAPTQDFVWRLVSARCRRTGQPAIAVDVLASTHAFRPPLTAQLPGANQGSSWATRARAASLPAQPATSWPTRSGRCRVCYDQRRESEGSGGDQEGPEPWAAQLSGNQGRKGWATKLWAASGLLQSGKGGRSRLWAAGLPAAIDAGMGDRARGCARPKASQADGQTSGRWSRAKAGDARARPPGQRRELNQALWRRSGTSAMIFGGAQNRALAPEQPARPPPTLVEDGRCCRWDGAVELGPPLEGDRRWRSVAGAADFSSAPLEGQPAAGSSARRRRSRGLWLPERLSSARRAVRSSGSPSAPAAR